MGKTHVSQKYLETETPSRKVIFHALMCKKERCICME
jgi:hypothetical protein